MNNISIVQGNRFNIYVPIVLLTTGGAKMPDMSALNVEAVLIDGCGQKIEISANSHENFVLLTGDTELLPQGVFDVELTGTYNARPIRYNAQGVIRIVANNAQSNWQNYITTDLVKLDTQLFIAGDWVTDEEFETLKETYRTKIAQAETARAQAETAQAQAEAVAYDAVKLLSDNYAKQGSNPQATNTTILDAVKAIGGGGGGGGSFPTDYARENTLQSVGDRMEENFEGVNNVIIETLEFAEETHADVKDLEIITRNKFVDVINALGMVQNTMFKGVPAIAQTNNVVTIAPNMRNIWGVVTGTLNITCGSQQTGIVNEFIVVFEAGANFALSINAGAGVVLRWNGGEPTFETGAVYEMSIIINNNNALILWAKFE